MPVRACGATAQRQALITSCRHTHAFLLLGWLVFQQKSMQPKCFQVVGLDVLVDEVRLSAMCNLRRQRLLFVLGRVFVSVRACPPPLLAHTQSFALASACALLLVLCLVWWKQHLHPYLIEINANPSLRIDAEVQTQTPEGYTQVSYEHSPGLSQHSRTHVYRHTHTHARTHTHTRTHSHAHTFTHPLSVLRLNAG